MTTLSWGGRVELGSGRAMRERSGGVSRRRFLGALATAGAAIAWQPVGRISVAEAEAAPPPGFPDDIDLYKQVYENWAQAIRVEDVWTCAPADVDSAVRVANWAKAHGHRLRPRGMGHNWSPLVLAPEQTGSDRVVMVDTTLLRRIETIGPGQIRVQAGATMDELLAHAERDGVGFTNIPEIGAITVGGALAIGGHGASVPAAGEVSAESRRFGTIDQLVSSLTAIVHDPASDRYVLRTYERGTVGADHLLVHIGRAFVVEVTFDLPPDESLQCESVTDVAASTLFGPPGSSGQSFESILDEAGRVEVLWFPFAQRPWTRIWRVRATRPETSREVSEPYNYPFTDNMPDEVAALAAEMLRGNGAATPLFQEVMTNVIAAGLVATRSVDIWGPSRTVLLTLGPSTLRVEQTGHAVVLPRGEVQAFLEDFSRSHLARLESYATRGEYPVNMPVELRATGLDTPRGSGGPHAGVPTLSALRPVADHPERDTAIWLNVVTLTGTPGASGFFADHERWLLGTWGERATIRPEWSKGWAYSSIGPWSDHQVVGHFVDAYGSPQVAGPGWSAASEWFDAADPHRIFGNPFIDRLFSSV